MRILYLFYYVFLSYLFVLFLQIFSDGTTFQGFTIPFTPGTHEWEYEVRTLNPNKAISIIEIYFMFRNHKGTAWFDHVSVAKLSDGRSIGERLLNSINFCLLALCELKFQSMYFRKFSPALLSNNPALPVNKNIKFILVSLETGEY